MTSTWNRIRRGQAARQRHPAPAVLVVVPDRDGLGRSGVEHQTVIEREDVDETAPRLVQPDHPSPTHRSLATTDVEGVHRNGVPAHHRGHLRPPLPPRQGHVQPPRGVIDQLVLHQRADQAGRGPHRRSSPSGTPAANASENRNTTDRPSETPPLATTLTMRRTSTHPPHLQRIPTPIKPTTGHRDCRRPPLFCTSAADPGLWWRLSPSADPLEVADADQVHAADVLQDLGVRCLSRMEPVQRRGDPAT